MQRRLSSVCRNSNSFKNDVYHWQKKEGKITWELSFRLSFSSRFSFFFFFEILTCISSSFSVFFLSLSLFAFCFCFSIFNSLSTYIWHSFTLLFFFFFSFSLIPLRMLFLLPILRSEFLEDDDQVFTKTLHNKIMIKLMNRGNCNKSCKRERRKIKVSSPKKRATRTALSPVMKTFITTLIA